MRALELNSEYYGVSRLQLMENAGQSVAIEVASRFKPDKARVAIFCGSGGNGGDGFVAARHLACLGFEVDVIFAGKSEDILSGETERNWVALQTLKGSVALREIYDSSLVPNVKAEVVVDALLGIGLTGALRPPILQLVAKINEMKAFCLSVDVPTGLDSDSGNVCGEAVRADLTVTFHDVKPGLARAKAEEYVGTLLVRGVGLPREFELFAGPGDVSMLTNARPTEAHKGDFGKLLVIGGSEGFSGAPALVALAALRTGVDLTYIVTPQKTAHAISSISPNLITVKLEGGHLNPSNIAVIKRYVEMSTAVVMGPGLGLHNHTKEAVVQILELIDEHKTPLLLDADGLKAFAKSPMLTLAWKLAKRKMGLPLVLTPHGGEYQLLTGRQPSKDLEKRVEEVRKTAQKLGAVILLKGPVDVISDGKRVKLNFTGNPGMTVGGTGDVLSGITGAFLAQHVDPFEAAVAGAFINGAAGDFVKSEKGDHMVPTDVIDWISLVMKDPMSHMKVRKLVSAGR